MCGICGFFYKNTGKPINPVILDRMVDKMVHRGPDEKGVYITQPGALGHRRLTIIDLVGGQQPMELPNEKEVLVYNGEIYNYLEIKKNYLSDIQFTSSSDTEVLLHFLHRKGTDAIPLLNGMFAFVYWDIENQKVIFARDPVGQKPLFYYFGSDSFIFSSELSSLACHPDLPKNIDVDSLAYYLLFEGYPHPHTPLKGVNKLSPGYFMVLNLRNWTLKKEKYWENLPNPYVFKPMDENKYLETFEEKLIQSMERHLRADVEVGIFLSGGLDSPTLVKAALSTKKSQSIKSFTIKHELDSFDEAGHAKEVARYFGIEHHERLLSQSDFLADIDPLLKNNDEPIADPGFLAIYQVAKFSSEFVKVVISGNGGDEFFAGYQPFQALGAYRVAHKLIPNYLAKFISDLSDLPRASFDYMNIPFRIQRFLRGIPYPPSEVLMHWIGSFNNHEIRAVLNKDILPNSLVKVNGNKYPYLYNSLHETNGELMQKDLFLTILNTFQQFYLPICICNHSDKASMRVSQELRSPFLDVEMMRFANQMPSQMKYFKGKTKYILRKYHERNSPLGVSKRPKQGFTVPIAHWLTTALKPWANDILDPLQIEKDGFFDAREVRRLWREHQERKINHGKKLWTIIVFQHWLHSVWSEWNSIKIH